MPCETPTSIIFSNNVIMPIMCLMKFVTFGAHLIHYSHSFANLAIYLKSLNRKFLRDSAVQTISNIVITSELPFAFFSKFFFFLHFRFVSIWMSAARKIHCKSEGEKFRYIALRKNAFMNAVNWTFSWNDSTGKSRHSPESFDNLLLNDAQTSRCVYLHGSDERRLKLVNHKWSVWQWEPKLYFTWIVESSTRRRTPPPVISIMLDIC